jgi:heptosyltransferase-2
MLGTLALPFWILGLWRRRPAPRRILWIGRYHLGDLIMLAPALLRARKQLPDAWFGLVVQQRYAADMNLASVADEALSEIDESLSFFRQFLLWRRRFREFRVDGVVFHRFTRPDLPAALAAIFENIPHRIGGGDKGVQALFTDAYFPSRREKVVEYHQNLVTQWLRPIARPVLLTWPHLIDIPPSKSVIYDVVIAPFAQHSKIWPFDSWRVLLSELRARKQRVALSASPSAATEAAELLRNFPWVDNLCHQSTSLGFLFETVQVASSIITVDTGIRHIAAMLGVPCIVIGHGREHRRIMDAYVPTERYIWNPVPCAPCGAEPCPLGHLQCIHGISPDAVLAAWESLTLKTPSSQ